MTKNLIKIDTVRTPNLSEDFALDVLIGLSSYPKSIPPKYLYDQAGSVLFQSICETKEYYPTKCEAEILQLHSKKIATVSNTQKIKTIVELGAGDGRKTRILLDEMTKLSDKLKYYPIDISESALTDLVNRFEKLFPRIKSRGITAEYFQGLQWLSTESNEPKLILILGGNIGNFDAPQSLLFLRTLWNSLNDGDLILMGLDLKKDVNVLLDAYNDKAGVTKNFNLNLLTRINRELGANFDLSQFEHFGTYDVKLGAMESFLLSLKDQDVYISSLNKRFHFDAFESIHTEYSFKYLPAQIEDMVEKTGFKIEEYFFDSRKYFTDVLIKVSKD